MCNQFHSMNNAKYWDIWKKSTDFLVSCKYAGHGMLFHVFCMNNVKHEEKEWKIRKIRVLLACTQTLVEGERDAEHWALVVNNVACYKHNV